MTNNADAIADLDQHIADVESKMATVRQELTVHAVPGQALNRLLGFTAIIEVRLRELRARRAELQRQRDNSAQ